MPHIVLKQAWQAVNSSSSGFGPAILMASGHAACNLSLFCGIHVCVARSHKMSTMPSQYLRPRRLPAPLLRANLPGRPSRATFGIDGGIDNI
eukprot:scaffold364700_cov39-Prasinocladus_malaysianus.AAC.1